MCTTQFHKDVSLSAPLPESPASGAAHMNKLSTSASLSGLPAVTFHPPFTIQGRGTGKDFPRILTHQQWVLLKQISFQEGRKSRNSGLLLCPIFTPLLQYTLPVCYNPRTTPEYLQRQNLISLKAIMTTMLHSSLFWSLCFLLLAYELCISKTLSHLPSQVSLWAPVFLSAFMA